MHKLEAKFSEHAKQRLQQRGIPEVAVWLLQEFGCRTKAVAGAEKVQFTKSTWKRVEQFMGHWPLKKMEQLRKLYLIVAPDGCIVTVAFNRKG